MFDGRRIFRSEANQHHPAELRVEYLVLEANLVSLACTKIFCALLTVVGQGVLPLKAFFIRPTTPRGVRQFKIFIWHRFEASRLNDVCRHWLVCLSLKENHTDLLTVLSIFILATIEIGPMRLQGFKSNRCSQKRQSSHTLGLLGNMGRMLIGGNHMIGK